MNVTSEEIRKIKAGQFKPFVCDDAYKMQSAATIVSQVKRLGMPDGVVDYEVQKFYDDCVVLVHALKEGDEKVLNK